MGYDIFCVETEHPENGVTDHYFRANIWGMGFLCQQMEIAGALDFTPAPPFPEMDPDSDEFEDAVRLWASFEGKRDFLGMPVGIPIDKLRSNDGWVISALEAGAVAIKCAGFVPDAEADNVEFWNRWIKFLRHVAANDTQAVVY